MSDPRVVGQILVPLINANEPEAQVVAISAESYGPIARGDVVCTLETSKSAVDVESDYDGYVGEIGIALDERVAAGRLICEVFDAPLDRLRPAGAGESPRPAGLKLTRKAEKLALESGLDLASLPAGRFVTEADVRALIAASGPAPAIDEAVLRAIDADALVVFGAGGFAKSVIDLVRVAGGCRPVCVVDDSPEAPADVLGVPVVGSRAALPVLRGHGLVLAANAVGALGRMQTRIDIHDHLRAAGFTLPTLVDPRAVVAGSATVGEGALVFAGAQICPAASIGAGTIVNTSAVVSHDCEVGRHVHLAPGCLLAGHVAVGDGTLVGMGVTTRVALRIGIGAIVGNGAVLLEDVPDGAIVPAGSVWPR